MNDRPLKDELIAYLRGVGYRAEAIQERDHPTPDLIVEDASGTRYVIEVKERTTRWDERAEVLAEDPSGRVLKRCDPSRRSNSVDDVLEHAAKQLNAAELSTDLRLVWLLADATDLVFLYEEVRQTAYGLALAIATPGGRDALKETFYASYASFARWSSSLDGILLGPFHGLFLNNLSPRYEQLRTSALSKQCGDAVLDPAALEAAGECYLVPVTGEAPSEAVVRRYLKDRHGVELVKLESFTRFSAVIEVKADTPRG